MKHVISYILSLAVVLCINSCSVNPVTGKKQVVFVSEAQEIAMGKEADPQIVQQFGLYEDKELQDFINAQGKKMAAVSHRPDLDYQFRIVDSEVLNAFAVPGGYVYFTRGIMAHFNNEAEFAGVLGHEIGHITARHSVIQQRNQILAQVGLIAGIVIVPELAEFANTASQGLGLLFLKFGRDDERESDRLGVEYSTRIGYDAQQMANFFSTLERKTQESGTEELPTFLSTHPSPGDRNVSVAQLAAEWKQKLNLGDAQVNRNSYLRRIEGLIYGEDPKQGFKEGNMFFHPELKFQFAIPEGWGYQNSPQRVQVSPKDGKAVLFLSMAPGNSLEEAASAVLKQYQLQAVQSRQITFNGLNAISVVADQIPQEGQQPSVRTLLYLIRYNDAIYLMLGATSIANFNSYQSVFASSMQSFRQLTDVSKLNKKAERIRIKTVNKNTSLREALASFNVPQSRLEEMAILNGMKLTDALSQGTLIKIVAE